MKHPRLLTTLALLASTLPAFAQLTIPPANGSDRAFSPGASVEVDLSLAIPRRRADLQQLRRRCRQGHLRFDAQGRGVQVLVGECPADIAIQKNTPVTIVLQTQNLATAGAIVAVRIANKYGGGTTLNATLQGGGTTALSTWTLSTTLAPGFVTLQARATQN